MQFQGKLVVLEMSKISEMFVSTQMLVVVAKLRIDRDNISGYEEMLHAIIRSARKDGRTYTYQQAVGYIWWGREGIE